MKKKNYSKWRLPRKKKKELKKRNRKLAEKYPFLVPRNVWTGKIPENYDYMYIYMEGDIPEGWWKRFGIPLCDDLKEVLIKNDCLDEFTFLQIKEKYGQIRLYDGGAPGEWHEHLRAWEYISEHTCINCGKFPVPMLYDSWISPWCSQCFRKVYNVPDENKILEITEKDWDGRVLEFLEIVTYSKEGKSIKRIDMKPYYRRIGWEFTGKDLISCEEMQEEKDNSF